VNRNDIILIVLLYSVVQRFDYRRVYTVLQPTRIRRGFFRVPFNSNNALHNTANSVIQPGLVKNAYLYYNIYNLLVEFLFAIATRYY